MVWTSLCRPITLDQVHDIVKGCVHRSSDLLAKLLWTLWNACSLDCLKSLRTAMLHEMRAKGVSSILSARELLRAPLMERSRCVFRVHSGLTSQAQPPHRATQGELLPSTHLTRSGWLQRLVRDCGYRRPFHACQKWGWAPSDVGVQPWIGTSQMLLSW
jgi:hypothetical protein